MNGKALEEAARQERRAYFRQWRMNNKARVRKYNEEYWKKRAALKLQEGEPHDSTTQNDDHP